MSKPRLPIAPVGVLALSPLSPPPRRRVLTPPPWRAPVQRAPRRRGWEVTCEPAPPRLPPVGGRPDRKAVHTLAPRGQAAVDRDADIRVGGAGTVPRHRRGAPHEQGAGARTAERSDVLRVHRA